MQLAVNRRRTPVGNALAMLAAESVFPPLARIPVQLSHSRSCGSGGHYHSMEAAWTLRCADARKLSLGASFWMTNVDDDEA